MFLILVNVDKAFLYSFFYRKITQHKQQHKWFISLVKDAALASERTKWNSTRISASQECSAALTVTKTLGGVFFITSAWKMENFLKLVYCFFTFTKTETTNTKPTSNVSPSQKSTSQSQATCPKPTRVN